MEQKMVCTVVGMTKFEGTIQGDRFKSCKLIVLLPMEDVDRKDADGERGSKGQNSVEYRTEDFRVWDSLKQSKFPVECELTLLKVSTGAGKTREVLVEAKPRGSQRVV